VPGIHVFDEPEERKSWMAGTSPAMTESLSNNAVEQRQAYQDRDRDQRVTDAAEYGFIGNAEQPRPDGEAEPVSRADDERELEHRERQHAAESVAHHGNCGGDGEIDHKRNETPPKWRLSEPAKLRTASSRVRFFPLQFALGRHL